MAPTIGNRFSGRYFSFSFNRFSSRDSLVPGSFIAFIGYSTVFGFEYSSVCLQCNNLNIHETRLSTNTNEHRGEKIILTKIGAIVWLSTIQNLYDSEVNPHEHRGLATEFLKLARFKLIIRHNCPFLNANPTVCF